MLGRKKNQEPLLPNPKRNEEVNVKYQSINVIEKNVGEYILDLSIGEGRLQHDLLYPKLFESLKP